MNNSISFKQLLDRLRERGFRRFVFDLSECEGFDSTFMGILLGLALGDGRVVIVNPSAQQRDLLSEVGIHRVVELCDRPIRPPDVDLEDLDTAPVDPRERVREMLVVHENLVRHDPRNREKFGGFLEALRRELGEESGS